MSKNLRALSGAAIFGCLALGAARAADTAGNLPADPVPEPKPYSLTIDSEIRAVSFRATRGNPTSFALGSPGRGSQLYAPTAIAFAWTGTPDWRFDVLARSGYIFSRQNSGGLLGGSISTLGDTSLTGKATYTGFGWIQPFVSLAYNAPTGRTFLKRNQAFSRLDPDIAEVAAFGEGANIGPTLGFSLTLSPQTLLTASFGHTRRGGYSRDGFGGGVNRVDPGDSNTYNLQLLHQFGDRLSLSLGALYVTRGLSRLNGAYASKSGSMLGLNGSLTYAWTPAHATTAAVSWSQGRRQTLIDPFLNLPLAEPYNSSSRTLRLALDHAWKIDESWTLGLSASWFRRDANGYPEDDLSFSSAKTKTTAGISASYKVSELFTLKARAEHIWLNERGRPDFSIPFVGPIVGTAVPAIRSRGLLLSLGGTANF